MSENTPAAEESSPRRVPSGPPALPEGTTASDPAGSSPRLVPPGQPTLPEGTTASDPAGSSPRLVPPGQPTLPEAGRVPDEGPPPLREGTGLGSGITPEQFARYRRDAIVAAVAYFLFSALLPVINLPHFLMRPIPLLLLTVLSTGIFMYLQLLLVRAVARVRQKAWTSLGFTLLYAGLWLVFLFFIRPHRSWGMHALMAFFIFAPAVVDLLKTLCFTHLGTLLSRIIREPNVLLPVAFVAMPIDYMGAMLPHGFTHDVVTHAPRVVEAVSVAVPTLRGVHSIPFIGPGDVLFMAFFLMAVQNMRLNERGTFRWMYALLTVTILIVMTPFAPPIAALIPMGLAVLIANWKFFKLQRSEVFAVIYASAIVVAMAAAFYAFTHHFFFRGR